MQAAIDPPGRAFRDNFLDISTVKVVKSMELDLIDLVFLRDGIKPKSLDQSQLFCSSLVSQPLLSQVPQ